MCQDTITMFYILIRGDIKNDSMHYLLNLNFTLRHYKITFYHIFITYLKVPLSVSDMSFSSFIQT